MSQTTWAVEGPDDTSVELEGRKFSSNDDGGPMLCNMVCKSMGRHVHIDICRGSESHNSETLHIKKRMSPDPDQDKDWITHALHWRRMGAFVMWMFVSRLTSLNLSPGFKGIYGPRFYIIYFSYILRRPVFS